MGGGVKRCEKVRKEGVRRCEKGVERGWEKIVWRCVRECVDIQTGCV